MIWERMQRGLLMDVFGVGGAVQGAAQIAGAGLQASAINKATDAQERAANNTLSFNKDVFNQQQQNLAPSLAAGSFGLNNMQAGLSDGLFSQMFSAGLNPQNVTPDGVDANAFGAANPDFAAPNTQTANFDPNSVNVQQDPGYRFRLDEGERALQNSQAATGITGGAAAKALAQYSQGLASQEYGNAYQRAFQSSQQNLAINNQNFGQAAQSYGLNSANHQQHIQNAFTATEANNQARLQAAQLNNSNQLNRYNAQTQDVSNLYNRYASLAQVGQTGNAQLQNASQAAAANIGNAYAGMGNAQSAGSAAMGNVWGNLSSGLGNTFNQYQMMRQLGGGGSGGTSGGIYDSNSGYLGE